MSTPVFDPSDWAMQYDDDNAFPFVEDENCNITGLGWQDRAEFADEVNRYDELATGEPVPEGERWGADDIAHQWAVLDADGERLRVPRWKPRGAIKVTTLWGVR